MQSHFMSTGISDVYGFLKCAIHCNVKANENEIAPNELCLTYKKSFETQFYFYSCCSM